MQAWKRMRKIRTMPRMGATMEEEELERGDGRPGSPGIPA